MLNRVLVASMFFVTTAPACGVDSPATPSGDAPPPASDDAGAKAPDGAAATPAPKPPTETPASNVVICDGSDDLRLVAQGGLAGSAHSPLQAHDDFIVVDGKCHFWISQASRAGSFGTGTLTDGEIEALSDALHVKYWSAWSGEWLAAGFDGYGARVRLGTVNVAVGPANNERGSQPASLTVEPWDVPHRVRTWIEERGKTATPMSGAVRVLALAETTSPTDGTWPLTEPLSGFRAPPSTTSSEEGGKLVEGRDAVALRSVWPARALSQPAILRDPTTSFLHPVHIRDALPFESADGKSLTR